MNTIFIVTYHKRTSIITPLERRHRLTSIILVRSAYVIELNYVENICTPYIMTESSLFFSFQWEIINLIWRIQHIFFLCPLGLESIIFGKHKNKSPNI